MAKPERCDEQNKLNSIENADRIRLFNLLLEKKLYNTEISSFYI